MGPISIKVSAPGKVIVHGEHSAVYGKTSIAAALGLRTLLVLQEITETGLEEPFIDLILVNLNISKKLHIKPILQNFFKTDVDHVENKWQEPEKFEHEKHANKIDDFFNNNMQEFEGLDNRVLKSLRGFLYLLTAMLSTANVDPSPMKVTIETDLTIGAGTGSSASYAVCNAAAFFQYIKLKLNVSGDNSHFSNDDKELINKWAFNCERIMSGYPSGLDNSACTYDSAVIFVKGSNPKPVKMNLKLRILLVDTRVPRDTKVILENVRRLISKNQQAVDHIMDAINHVTIAAIHSLEKICDSSEENLKSEYEHLAELWEMNHCLLSSLLVSHPTIEEIRREAREFGLACKLTGAGGGGNAIILIPPYISNADLEKLKIVLSDKGFGVKDVYLGGPGVRLEASK